MRFLVGEKGPKIVIIKWPGVCQKIPTVWHSVTDTETHFWLMQYKQLCAGRMNGLLGAQAENASEMTNGTFSKAEGTITRGDRSPW